MTRTTKWLILLVSLQALFLLGLAGTSYAAAWFGQAVKLKTVPVDPRDVLYGDYVTLQYEISRLSPSLWRGEAPPEQGTAAYTVLVPEGEYYKAAAVYPHKPELKSGEIAIKGRVDYSWNEEIHVRYGIERYYVPEGTGLELERQAGHLAMTVRIASWGQNVITGVEVLP